MIARYQGISGHDWVAIPLIPYLYSVDSVSQVPERVDKATVQRLRTLYHEDHLNNLGEDVREGDFFHGGWTQLVGEGYERRVYAFRFATTEQQDDGLMLLFNSQDNRSDFNLFYSNCGDFARSVLNVYFPNAFHRSFFPDAFMTTPKQVTYRLVRYARKHPEMQLTVFEIPQIPGYRQKSHSNKSVAASLMRPAYAIPIALINPYLAGGLFVDYLVRGRYHAVPKHRAILTPDHLSMLGSGTAGAPSPEVAGAQASGASARAFGPIPVSVAASPPMKENATSHE